MLFLRLFEVGRLATRALGLAHALANFLPPAWLGRTYDAGSVDWTTRESHYTRLCDVMTVVQHRLQATKKRSRDTIALANGAGALLLHGDLQLCTHGAGHLGARQPGSQLVFSRLMPAVPTVLCSCSGKA